MTHQPSPETVIEDRMRVSLVQLITEARAMMQAESQDGASVKTWRKVCGWLEAKLPEGIRVADLDDPMLSPEANETLRAQTRQRDAVTVGPGTLEEESRQV